MQEATPVPKRSFDFIVVGAGAAGPAIAARLSEDPHVSVLLLEAGGDGSLLSTLPVGIPFLFDTYDTPIPLPLGENPIDWGYKGGRGDDFFLALNKPFISILIGLENELCAIPKFDNTVNPILLLHQDTSRSAWEVLRRHVRRSV